MSNEELLQLWTLPKRIQLLRREIERCSMRDIPLELRSETEEQINFLKQRLTACQAEYDRRLVFITSIPDQWIKTAFSLRYVQRLCWAAVGTKMELSPDCCRKMVMRYLKRLENVSVSAKGETYVKETAK